MEIRERNLKRYPYTTYTTETKSAEENARRKIARSLADEWIETFNDVKATIDAGLPIYVRVNSGDYAGSIAKIKVELYEPAEYSRCWGGDGQNVLGTLMGRLVFDGTKNSTKYFVSHDVTWLQHYTGPTIYKRIDKKARSANILANAEFIDRYGNELKVGDSVVYVNIRYGSGSSLERGKIVEMIVKAQETAVVVLNEDGQEKSTIKNFESLIMKA